MLNAAKDIEPNRAPAPVRQVRILIVDDSEVDRKRLLRFCQDAGLNPIATEVASVQDMKAALAAHRFDLVFIDYLLPGENGLDAADAMTGDPDQPAISIMIAGEGRIDIAVEAMRRGCSDYLTKSDLSVDAVRKSVATALERRMTRAALAEERGRRLRLEQAVRRYADECSVEMRTILAGTLRRVRMLRAHAKSAEHGEALGDLERSIDRLWDALPRLEAAGNLASQQVPRLIAKA